MSKDFSRRQVIVTGAAALAVTTVTGKAAQQPEAVQQPTPQKQEALKEVVTQQSTQPKAASPKVEGDDTRTKLEKQFKLKPKPQPKKTNASQGKEPLPRDEAQWSLVSKRLQSAYSITNDGKLKGPLNRSYLAIDNDFKFVAIPELDREFRMQHLESLLDQAADIIERSLRDRAEWDDKATKAFTIGTELLQFVELDKIHKDEIQAGFYELAVEQSEAAREAEETSAFGASIAGNYLQSLLNNQFSFPEMTHQVVTSQLVAWLAHLAAYQFPFQGELLKNSFSSSAKTTPEHMMDAAAIQAWFNLTTEQVLLMVQNQAQETASQAAQARERGLEVRSDWDSADVQFRRRRTQVSRDIIDLKTKAFTEPGGVLNFPERMISLKQRFQRDFRDALARVFVAQDGLKKIYGYETPIPPAVRSLVSGETVESSRYYDESLIWVRDAISWIIRFGQNDQNYALPISIKAIMSEADWNLGKQVGFWEPTILETLFPNQVHVRLRGLSAFVSIGDDHSDGVWQLTAQAPDKSFCTHLTGSRITLDQSMIPPIRLGRVARRDNARNPDIGGVVALHNVSPFGKWKLKLSDHSTDQDEVKHVKDLILDLHVAVRSK